MASLTLEDGRVLQASLVVGADGANSWVRSQTALAASIKPYGQSGVVANFSCENRMAILPANGLLATASWPGCPWRESHFHGVVHGPA
jgi:2-polyprenyl-6-methoxyphenol hydroxylase-like FAD-dependent oxidoreductase